MFKRCRDFFKTILAIVLVFGAVSCGANPAKVDSPQIAATLEELRTVCESNVQALKAKKIHGRKRYEKAQGSANGFIKWMTTTLRGNVRTTRKEIEDHLKQVNDSVGEFSSWAQTELASGQAGTWGLAAEIIAALATSAWNVLQQQDQTERDKLADELEKCKFRSWQDISQGNGHKK